MTTVTQSVLDENSCKMLAEEEEARTVDSWEGKAEQLFSLCDRECKGFITKRDLQRLWGELPLGPDELEGVFDSLDQDKNGFLTLQEFTDGFGHHLGLVVEFQAECESNKGSEGEKEEEEEEEDKHLDIESGSISSQQIDEILNTFAKHDFDISSAVVESVWHDVCQGADDAPEGSGLGRLVAALLQELSRVKSEQSLLESALNSKTDQHNQQVSRLYEELESQISGERNKAAAEHNVKEARVLASLEEEVRDREAALRILQEEHAALIERVERLTAADLAAKQDNVRLTHHLNKLEEDLSLKAMEVEELTATVDHLKKNTKDEKRRRANQALRVSEGIALERESLATQLDLLRTINTQLRDEHDQSQPDTNGISNRTRKTGNVTSDTDIPPIAAKRTSITTTTFTPISPAYDNTHDTVMPKPQPQDILPLQSCDVLDKVSLDVTQTSTDLEHDELYFQNSKLNPGSVSVLPALTTFPTETSLFQELLEHPSMCVSCGGTLSHQTDAVDSPQRRVTFRRKDSMTQTPPIIVLTGDEELEDSAFGVMNNSSPPTTSPDVVMPAQISAESTESYSKLPKIMLTSVEEPKSCLKRLNDPDITRNCSCDRDGSQSPPTPHHSSTIILYHPGESSPPDLLPRKHTNNTYIQTQHKHHSHAFLTVTQLQSQSTNTQSEDFQNQESVDVKDDGHQTTQSDMKASLQHSSVDDVGCPGFKSTETQTQDTTYEDAEVDMNHHSSGSSSPTLQKVRRRRLPKTTSSSPKEQTGDKRSDFKNLKDNIKNYISDKSQYFSKASHQGTENGEVHEMRNGVPNLPITTSRVFKIVFIGDSGVGKTTFIHRASIGEFRSDFGSTVGVDYRLMEICVGGVRALLQLWDTAGQERYRAITRQYYRKADGVVVMYDVTSESSFLSVADWISSVRELGDSAMVMAVIGNKMDLHDARQVNLDVAYKLSKAHNSLMYECSAATGCGVREAMKHLAAVLTTDQEHDIDTSATVTLHRSPKLSNKCC